MARMAPQPRIGTKIRRAMERKRMDQIQLAEALGVSRSAVNSWINDRSYPMNSVGALEELLEVDLTGDKDADLQELEIHELAVRLGLAPEDEDAWLSVYRQRKRAAVDGERGLTG